MPPFSSDRPNIYSVYTTLISLPEDCYWNQILTLAVKAGCRFVSPLTNDGFNIKPNQNYKLIKLFRFHRFFRIGDNLKVQSCSCKMEENDQFDMKHKCWKFRIAIIYGSRNIHLGDLMVWNRSNLKSMGSTC